MAGQEPPKDSREAFELSLEGLTFNSKPQIDDLTRAAGQFEAEESHIIEVIETRIMKVCPELKLPSLYLMDSIMKNLKGSYLKHISQVIVGVFCHCFEKLTVSEPRKSLYKLRTTWTPFLSQQKLAAIDKYAHELDPNWPVIAVDNDPHANTIFVNPEFMGKQTRVTRPQPATAIQDRRKILLQQTKSQRQEQEREMGLPVPHNLVDKDPSADHKPPLSRSPAKRSRSNSPLDLLVTSKSQSDMVSKLDAPKKIKLENNCDDSRDCSNVIKQSHLDLDDIPAELLPTHHENMLKRIERLINTGNVTPEQKSTLEKQLNQLYELQKQKTSSNPSEVSFNSQLPTQGARPPHLKPVQSRGRGLFRAGHGPYRGRGHTHVEIFHDAGSWSSGSSQGDAGLIPVNDLFQSLVRAGIVDNGRIEEPGNHPLKIPNLTLTPATLKQRYTSVIALLHIGDPCSSCGLRFLSNTGDLYRSHLNWHYKTNRQEKEGHSKTSRNWFMHPDDWLKYEEVAEESDGNGVNLELPKEESPVRFIPSENCAEVSHEAGICSVEAGDVNEVCTACNEPFEQFWEEEEAAWHLRDALRSEPGSKLYHTFCHKPT